jgi:peptidoglycan/LPS O-acetylase OafA/YrhL
MTFSSRKNGSLVTPKSLEFSPNDTAPRNSQLDGLRALAVVLVICAHSGFSRYVPGATGVTIFFVISGFIITSLLIYEKANRGSFSAKKFFFRRFVKIVPPLFIFALLPGIIGVLNGKLNAFHVSSQALFFFNWIQMNGHARVALGSNVVWSLSIEEQFYLAFAMIWMFLMKTKNTNRNLVALGITVLLISNVLRIYLAFGPNAESRIYYGSDTRMDSIASGMVLAAHMASKNKNIRSGPLFLRLNTEIGWVVAALLLLSNFLLGDEILRNSIRYSSQSLAAAIAVALLVWGSKDSILNKAISWVMTRRPIVAIGLASYSIYLSHSASIYFLRQFSVFSGNLFSTNLVVSILSLLPGLAGYYAIEKPILSWRLRLENHG